jgi:hypothetical protein
MPIMCETAVTNLIFHECSHLIIGVGGACVDLENILREK